MTNAKYIFTASDTIDTAVAAAEKCNILQENIFVLHFHEEEVPNGYKSWRSLLKHGTRNWLSVNNPADTTAVHASTSGTSGLPKAAVLSHAYMTFQGETHCRTLSSNQDVSPYLFTIPSLRFY
jgi:acyl-CoA synthetase (AMP-forming)/AMP-acid ligase II